MLKFADRVKETTTITGTGSISLGGAPSGFRAFNAVMASSDTCYYCIDGKGSGEWEVGLGTFTSPSTLARTTILASSNSGSAVSFSAGTKDVLLTVPAKIPSLSVPIDLSAASSDYPLAAGETAFIDFADATSIPLYISAIDKGRYRIAIECEPATAANVDNALLINNATTSNVQQSLAYNNSSSGQVQVFQTLSDTSFHIGAGTLIAVTIEMFIRANHNKCLCAAFGEVVSCLVNRSIVSRWSGGTISSLGTVTLGVSQSGRITVTRII